MFIVLVVIFCIAIAGSYLQYCHEKERWNNGVCLKCGTPWVCFDTDSNGGRGYHCSNGHGVWISYDVDKE